MVFHGEDLLRGGRAKFCVPMTLLQPNRDPPTNTTSAKASSHCHWPMIWLRSCDEFHRLGIESEDSTTLDVLGFPSNGQFVVGSAAQQRSPPLRWFQRLTWGQTMRARRLLTILLHAKRRVSDSVILAPKYSRSVPSVLPLWQHVSSQNRSVQAIF